MKFTVITSVYNQRKYLDLIFDAMKKQTHKDWEWIIADDGSSDGVLDWCRKNKVDYVTQKHEKMRLARIMNKAIFKAKGDCIVTVMGDSVPDKKMLEGYEKHMTLSATVGNGLRVFVKDPFPVEKIKAESNFLEDDWRKKQIGMIGMVEKPWRMFTGNNLCVSRVDYEKIKAKYGHYWNEAYVGYGLEDWELAINLWEMRCEFVPVPEALVYHISHPKMEESENNQLLHWKKVKEINDKYGLN